MKEKKARKAYPTLEERLEMVDVKIDHLQQLNAEREQLILKTESILAERKSALEKSKAQLDKALKRKERLLKQKSKPEKIEVRPTKNTDKKNLEELLSVLKAKGMSLEDAVAQLKRD